MRKATDSDWVVFTLTMVGSAMALVALTLLLVSADRCAPNVSYCSDVGRSSVEIMLGLSTAWFFYLIIRFARNPDKF